MSNQTSSEKLKQLERELEEIHTKARGQYVNRQTTSPIRNSAMKAADQISVKQPYGETKPGSPEDQSKAKPTYLEEKHLAVMPRHVTSREKGTTPKQPTIKGRGSGKSKFVFRIGLALFGLAFISAGFFLLVGIRSSGSNQKVGNWEECLQAKGSVIQESYPRVCVTKAGQRFTETIATRSPTPTPTPSPTKDLNTSMDEVKEDEELETTVKDGCVIGGCNSEICAEVEMDSICVFRPEATCYKTAICERQEDGECGWTQTTELQACLGQY